MNTNTQDKDTLIITLDKWLETYKEAEWEVRASCEGSEARQVAECKRLVARGILLRSGKFSSGELKRIAADYILAMYAEVARS